MMPDRRTLADLGREVVALFERVCNQKLETGDAAAERLSNAIVSEAERFELWAVNLGLFVSSHGSLDYRLRESHSLEATISRLMGELLRLLEEIIRERQSTDCAPSAEGEDEESDGSDSDSDRTDGSADESPTEMLLDGIRDIVDRLYKVSTKIRNTSSRSGTSRAARHEQVDPETGVDFLRAAEAFDYDHIRSLFLEYKKLRSLQEHEVRLPWEQDTQDVDDVWEPIRTVLSQDRISTDQYLIRRISSANTRRRQQFAYWRNHREKLTLHARASISTQGPIFPTAGLLFRPAMDRNPSSSSGTGLQGMLHPVAPSVTTATNLNPARLEVMGTKSVVSVSEYEPSVWRPARDVVDFPPPPRTKDDDRFFECPYCFVICPKGSDKAWKAHLVHDLRPYICTYENCKTPNQLYETRQDWIHHENTPHRRVWRCLEHADQAFTEMSAYQIHLQTDHALQLDATAMNQIIRASESTFTVVDRACPICSVVLDTPKTLNGHIALHLERFALFSLPRSTGFEDDGENDVSGSGSALAQGVIAGSRDEDFDSELNFDSGSSAAGNTSFDAIANEERSARPHDSETVGSDSDIRGTTKVHTSENTVTDRTSLDIDIGPAVRDEPQYQHNTMAPSTDIPHTTAATVITDHNTPVYTVCFSPEDRYLASVSDDKVVRIWDVQNKTSLAPLEGHRLGFRSLAWSHDGSKMASGSYDKSTKIWDATTFQCLHTLVGHKGAVSGLAFAPDDKTLVSASHDKTCKVWGVETGKERFTLAGHTAGIWSIGISPDGRFIVSGSNDRTVRIWDSTTGAFLRTLKGHGRVIYAVAFSPDSKILATGSNDWTIKIWELDSGRLLSTLKCHTLGVTALAFSPDGRFMVSGSYDHTIIVWDCELWHNIAVLRSHSADVYAVAISNDGYRLASGSRDRTVRIQDLDL